ncbi:hypothetical protein TELCIR_26260, partial [Teladorsagia circumcincta]
MFVCLPLLCFLLGYAEGDAYSEELKISRLPSGNLMTAFRFTVTSDDTRLDKEREMHLRYSAVGKETVCTENMTPWKKLLPCKQNGLVTLLNPLKLYESVYHAMGLELYQHRQ